MILHSIGNDPRFQITDERFAIEEDEEDNDEEESDEDDGLNILFLNLYAVLAPCFINRIFVLSIFYKQHLV